MRPDLDYFIKVANEFKYEVGNIISFLKCIFVVLF